MAVEVVDVVLLGAFVLAVLELVTNVAVEAEALEELLLLLGFPSFRDVVEVVGIAGSLGRLAFWLLLALAVEACTAGEVNVLFNAEVGA
jgi:hypothetical protein